MIFLVVFPWLLVAVAVASVAGRTVRFRDVQVPSHLSIGCQFGDHGNCSACDCPCHRRRR